MLEGAPPEKRERYRSVLQEETRRLANLVTDILDLSRMEMGVTQAEFSRLDLNETIQKIVDANLLGAEAKGLQLVLDAKSDLPMIWADENQMTQAVNNLVSNAINYTDQGVVRVSTQLEDKKDWVRLEVQDTGYGIDENDLPHLFERFYRGKQAGQSTIPGTGLGLAITKEIISGHHGQIEVISKPGEGSLFIVTLPTEQRSESRNG
jgi:signal transduction histidine kinase